MFVYTIQKPVTELQPGDVIIAAGNRALTLERPTGRMMGYQSWDYTRYEGNGNGPTGAVGADIQLRTGSKVTVLCVDISADEPAPDWTDQPCTCTPHQLCTPCSARGYTNPLAGYAARIYPRPVCEWCADTTNPTDYPDTDLLCRSHLAEWEGMSEAELDRGDAIQLAEYMDTLG